MESFLYCDILFCNIAKLVLFGKSALEAQFESTKYQLYFIDNFRDSNNDTIKILQKPPRAKFDLILFTIRFLCRRCSFSQLN